MCWLSPIKNWGLTDQSKPSKGICHPLPTSLQYPTESNCKACFWLGKTGYLRVTNQLFLSPIKYKVIVSEKRHELLLSLSEMARLRCGKKDMMLAAWMSCLLPWATRFDLQKWPMWLRSVSSWRWRRTQLGKTEFPITQCTMTWWFSMVGFRACFLSYAIPPIVLKATGEGDCVFTRTVALKEKPARFSKNHVVLLKLYISLVEDG